MGEQYEEGNRVKEVQVCVSGGENQREGKERERERQREK